MGISTRQQGRLFTLTLDNQANSNALDAGMLGAIGRALDHAEADPALRVLAIRARGAVFCSGADLAGTASMVPADGAQLYFATLRRLAASPVIVVSAVEGAVLAGGVGLVAASDYVLCSAQASFRLPEVLIGLIPACVLPFLCRRVGVHNSQMLALSAQKIDAERAVALHLADQLAPDMNDALRRFVLSVERIPEQAVAALKTYMGQLAPITDAQQALAVGSIAALMEQPGSLDRVHELAGHGLWTGSQP